MTPQQIERVKELLTASLGRSTVDRKVFLEESCDDTIVRNEVLSLLAQESVPAPILDQPVLAWLEPLPDEPAAAPLPIEVGTRIGPYLVVGLLGKGGMGTVVLAQREDDFEKRVALKIIRPDGVSSETLRRFDNERRLLARLEHPNVARILDGGTTEDGRPFFAMEYVEGVPLDAYCDSHDLSVEERLELFLQVCAAVQTAHQSLVVHRDLKPANILVNAEGVPKLLDFGIAKNLDSQGMATMTVSGSPLTLGYASPEQVDAHPDRPITTASDVYSLGVILFELLTGQRPYRLETDSFAALVRAICHDASPLPSETVSTHKSAFARRLVGDLDAIVRRALQKDARDRYPSVQRLSDDIRRHLDGLPVTARQGTFSYHAWKFVRRHRGQVAAAFLVLLTAIGVTAYSMVMQQREEVARKKSDDVLNFMKDVFKRSKTNEDGQEVTAQKLMQIAQLRANEENDPLIRAEVLNTIGEIYTSWSAYEEALEPREEALKIQRAQHARPHVDLAIAINNLGTNLYHLKRYDEAERLYREALSMKNELDDGDVDAAKSISNLATIVKVQKRYTEAEALYRQALAIRASMPGEERELSATQRNLANLLYTVGEYEEAERLAREALAIRLEIYGPNHTYTASVANILARSLHAGDHLDDAEEYYRMALDILAQRRGEDHPHTAGMKSNLASLYLDRGELEKAEAFLEDALKVLVNSPGSALYEARSTQGALLVARGKVDEAEPLLRESLAQLVEIHGENATRSRRARQRLESFEDAKSGRQNAGRVTVERISSDVPVEVDNFPPT